MNCVCMCAYVNVCVFADSERMLVLLHVCVEVCVYGLYHVT